MRTTRQQDIPNLRLFDPAELTEPAPDPFAGLLTPSRDHWRAVVFEEVMELLELSGLTEREKAEQIVAIVEREQRRGPVAEER